MLAINSCKIPDECKPRRFARKVSYLEKMGEELGKELAFSDIDEELAISEIINIAATKPHIQRQAFANYAWYYYVYWTVL